MLRHYYENRIYRDDWLLPESPALLELSVGDSAKLNNGGERFFVVVTAVDGDRVVGRVDNHLVRKRPYGYGDRVEFSRRHVWFVRDAAGRAALAAELKQQEADRPGSLAQLAHSNVKFVPGAGLRDNSG